MCVARYLVYVVLGITTRLCVCQEYTVYLNFQDQWVLEPSCRSKLRRLKHSQGTDLAKAIPLYLDNSRLILAEDRKAVSDSRDERTVRV